MKRLSISTSLLLLIGTLLLAVACGSEQTTAPSPATEAPATAAQSSIEPVSEPASESGSQQPTTQQASNQPATTQPATTQPATTQQVNAPSPQASVAVTTPEVSEPAPTGIRIVTTSNIVADWVRQVGQGRVEVFSLLPADADPHTYQPGARDVAQIADADMVLSIGLSLEGGWLTELVENAAQDPEKVIELGEAVDPIDFVEIFGGHGATDAPPGRLIVGDGETGAVSVIELDHDELEQDILDLGSRAGRIYATHSGRFAIAVSSDANAVNVIDGGLYLEAHGDHFDMVSRELSSVGLDLTGDRPVHLYVGEEWATVFYDGSGEVVLLNEHALEEEGASYDPPRINAGPHHGAALPLEDDLFAVTAQHPNYDSNPEQYRLPRTVHIRDLTGKILYTAGNCPDLHGDAGNGHLAVFGCTGGVLAVAAEGGQYSHAFIPAPAGSPEDFRLTSVWGAPGADHFFALGSSVGLYVVEPEEGEMEQMIPASEELRPIQAALSRDGESLVVVMNDGEIRLYDTHDLAVIASNADALVTPVETGFWARPHIALAPGAIFITDSVGGHVLQLDDHDLEVVNDWEVDGTPVKIAYVGILGETEGHEEEGHGHEEEGHGHHHGHDHGDLDPHFWFDPVRVQQAVNSIAARLSGIDPEGQSHYRDNALAYNGQLDELHNWIVSEVANLPEEERLLVTSHDSFQYFAQRYHFTVVGAILPVTTEAEPSARDLAELIETIEHSGATAVFAERSHSNRLAQQIANETGAQLVGTLYTGSLGQPDSEAGNYMDFMRYNVKTIVEALQ